MKTIGLLGATSFESNLKYIDAINKTVRHRLGGQHTANCIHCIFDFEEIEGHFAAERWDALSELSVRAAANLEIDGADFIVLCSNALHKVLPDIERAVRVPILHVVEVVADELVDSGIETVGILGTRYTMTQDFYKPILEGRGIASVVPPAEEVELVHSIIYNEICHGIITEQSRRKIYRVIDGLCEKGAEGIVLACAEISMMARQEDTEIPLFDTQLIHAERAALLAIQGGPRD